MKTVDSSLVISVFDNNDRKKSVQNSEISAKLISGFKGL